MKTKWNKISELVGEIAKDSTLSTCYRDLECMGHAPHIGYRSWIFKYKGVLIALCDIGNGHYDFHTAVNWIDLLVARLCKFLERHSDKRLIKYFWENML